MDHSSAARGATPVYLLTGFLGSGKTTLLRALLRQPAMASTAVVINEFGEIGLDHELVEAVDGETVLLPGGCMCCTVRDDLARTLADLDRRRAQGEVPPFERVIIESTGLADPGPVLQVLLKHGDLLERFALGGVWTTLDAVHAQSQLDAHVESVRQLALADCVVMTKTDLAPFTAPASLAARVRKINPHARMLHVCEGAVDAAELLAQTPSAASGDEPEAMLRGLCQAGPTGHVCGAGCGPHAHAHDGRFRTSSLRFDRPLEWDEVCDWLGGLAFFHGARLLRMKGILNVAGEDRPLAVHGVQHLFHPPTPMERWPDDDRSSRLVFITDGLDEQALRPPFSTA
ncbi:putative GTP-binding protein YjiA [Pigmentiphaga humi]|uniref:Putative GTP-binding protein YjiA n=1 Tax=Pigmentiphaga humi TaxID=2478468 RepID=A0A3P4AXU8_9BURK|nr:GTP-binding protein [Pigmentiphaga humi]VCU68857.1 putative GTP-binding protein YjiA [Pigmentiphaga humi]